MKDKKKELKVKEIAQTIFDNKEKHAVKKEYYVCPNIPTLIKTWNITPIKAGMVSSEYDKIRYGHKEYERKLDHNEVSHIARKVIDKKDKFMKLVPNRENIMKEFDINKDMCSLVCNEVKKKQESDRAWKLKMELKKATEHITNELEGIKY